jgi:hypothetical protein
LQGRLAEPSSPPSHPDLAFSAQRSLTRPCTCQNSFSVCLVTGLPHGCVWASVSAEAERNLETAELLKSHIFAFILGSEDQYWPLICPGRAVW